MYITAYKAHLGCKICFSMSWKGMMLKLKFGAIRVVVRGVVVFGVCVWDKIRHQIVCLMSCVNG